MKNALITGGASGFGAEVARQLTRRGDQVVLLDVNDTDGAALAAELGGHYLHCDVSDPEQVAATTAEGERLLGGLDLFFLNAGIATGCGVGEDFDLTRYRRAMAINTDGVVFGVHSAMPALQRRGGGAIVCTASMAALTATAFDPVYGANKSAVVGLVRAMGPVLAPMGVTINAFCPGFAETKIINEMREALDSFGTPIIPVEKAGAAVLEIFDSGLTGKAWLLQAGRDLIDYQFKGIPGPLTETGERAGVLPA
ncbi:MAG TPA: SDR family NAD(P)-dependent oxidoreductase [Mycobacteriales bacterium]|nr:SDR family NAD(P)-dependent oxidoreductase [Mycobacteriales bacterium]